MPHENALTPDEWRLVRLWRAGKMPGGKVRGAIDQLWSPEICHAVAAQCLYGEPFGFTHDDLKRLRHAAVNCRETRDWARDIFNLPRADEASRAATFYDSLADRIEALLPPEP